MPSATTSPQGLYRGDGFVAAQLQQEGACSMAGASAVAAPCRVIGGEFMLCPWPRCGLQDGRQQGALGVLRGAAFVRLLTGSTDTPKTWPVHLPINGAHFCAPRRSTPESEGGCAVGARFDLEHRVS